MQPAQTVLTFDRMQDTEEASMATTFSPPGSVRGQEGPPPSESRRHKQEKASSNNKGLPLEQWKELGLSCLGGDGQTDRVSTGVNERQGSFTAGFNI